MLHVTNLNVEEELYRAIVPIIGRRKLSRTTRHVIVRYAREWALADPRTTDAKVIRSVARMVWPKLAPEHAEARTKTITIQYRKLIGPLISALLDVATRNAVMRRVIAQERTAQLILRLADLTAHHGAQRTLADSRYPVRRTRRNSA